MSASSHPASRKTGGFASERVVSLLTFFASKESKNIAEGDVSLAQPFFAPKKG